MIEIVRYRDNDSELWDSLVHRSKNSTFLFERKFMDYHKDRFIDCSLLIYKKGRLEAIFPANLSSDTIHTHQGLTYGGVITTAKITTVDMLDILEGIVNYYRGLGVKKIIYKTIPYIYASQPSQEDVYALFRYGAKQIGCNISSTIEQANKIPYSELRNRCVRKAVRLGVSISDKPQIDIFWDILVHNLQSRYGVNPVHTLEEIKLLQSRFPNNIILHTAEIDNIIVAGVLMFVSHRVAHVQYISANEEGKSSGALDMLFNHLIHEVYCNKEYFDFGQSTERAGEYLNQTLLSQKEGFGARAIVYNIYELDL